MGNSRESGGDCTELLCCTHERADCEKNPAAICSPGRAVIAVIRSNDSAFYGLVRSAHERSCAVLEWSWNDHEGTCNILSGQDIKVTNKKCRANFGHFGMSQHSQVHHL